MRGKTKEGSVKTLIYIKLLVLSRLDKLKHDMHILMGNLEFAILFVSTEESPPPGLRKICAFGAWAGGNLFR